MIPDDKMFVVIEQLLGKSQKNEVLWRQTDTNEFTVDFPASKIVVFAFFPQSDPDMVTVTVVRNGSPIGETTAEAGSASYKVLKALFDDARRVVTGWDSALDEIEAALRAEGPVGRPTPPPVPSAPPPPTGDDIPF